MIIVLASIANENAPSFAAEFADVSASVVTCYDIAGERICLCHPDFEKSTVTVGGRRLRISEIEGVVNLLSSVVPAEMFFYGPEEREYQAAEMHALLTFFLTALKCPVVNRPTTMSLNGPVLNPIGWYHVAREAGIPLSNMVIESGGFNSPFAICQGGVLETIYVAGDIITPSGTVADDYTARLARHVHLGYVKARYSHQELANIRFVGADTTPDIRCEGC